jgi:DNA transposition AAA+ family ATPase
MKKAKYPQNIEMKVSVIRSGLSITDLANKIGVSRQVLSNTLNGHYKGVNILRLIEEEIK